MIHPGFQLFPIAVTFNKICTRQITVSTNRKEAEQALKLNKATYVKITDRVKS